MWSAFKSFTRISSFARKEILEVLRRPGAFFSLVLGPFLIMAVFGAGYTGVRRPLDTVLVVPPDAGLSRNPADYRDLAGAAFRIVEIAQDPAAAEARLARQQVDLVVIAPPDLQASIEKGQQAVIRVVYNQIDPVLANYAAFIAGRLSEQVNQAILTRVVGQGQEYLVRRTGSQELTRIPPEIVAAPTRVEATNIAQTQPGVIPFFAPAVLALILQHMGVTLTALSLVRDRLTGSMELFRVSPASTYEILIGKYIGFGTLTVIVGAIVTLLIVLIFRVPLKSDPFFFSLAVLLIIIASLGLGMLISVIADSERQAVQLSLLVLLASVFFGGLVLPIAEFHPLVQAAAHTLPVTSGIRLLQDSMLRGGTYAWQLLVVLLGASVAFFFLTSLLLRRTMNRG